MLSHGRIEIAPAPFLLIVMGALILDLGFATQAMAPASQETPLAEFFASALGVRVAVEIFLFSAAAGLFVVPLFAAIQAWAGEDRRARVVGAVNALNYIFMVCGSIVTMILLQIVGLTEPAALIVLASGQFRRRCLLLSPLAGELHGVLPARPLARPVPARGARARKPAAASRAERDRDQPRVVPRRADHALAHGRAAGVRDRQRNREALVD